MHLLFVSMKEKKINLWYSGLRSGLFIVLLFPLLLARCTREETIPDSFYSDPLSVVMRFADDAGLMHAGIMRSGNFMEAFPEITSSSGSLISTDSILRNGSVLIRKNYLWKDTIVNYRKGSVNYPGFYGITEVTPKSHELDFDIRFYRNDSLQVFFLKGQMNLSHNSAGFYEVSGSFSITNPQGEIFDVKIDLKKQHESGKATPTFNDDRWLDECTGIISARGKDIRFATLTPLVRVSSGNCDFQAGEAGLSASGWPAQIFSYGNGGCDRIYYLSENSNQKKLNLP